MKDEFCAYYTNSDDITSYMTKRLGVSEQDLILEPSAGEGDFIDQIINMCSSIHIDALDIDKRSIDVLNKKYSNKKNITVRRTDTLLDKQLDSFSVSEIWIKQTDTLIDEQLDYFSKIGGHYDKVIGNPPYGAWQDYEKRDFLKKKYPGQYVKETYSLFLLRCISVLKIGGRLSFIVPDTFMFLNLHSKLRKVLLTMSKIEEILIFPSKFFPGVNFGYSNLSIITLERADREDALSNQVRIIKGFRDSAEFSLLFESSKLPKHLQTFSIRQSDIFSNDKHKFILAEENITNVIKNSSFSLGDVADVVTGFYTGDNKRFIKALNNDVKGAKNYEKINPTMVYDCASLHGISGVEEGYIPYVKSASKTRYYRQNDEWFVRWDEKTINYYNSNKKSRFQNSTYYFKTGVAIPMVKSRIIRAFLIQNRVFDQSIVGIFPKNPNKINYILALMNSDAINKLIHVINPTANNSANYIKKIPYLEPEPDKIEIINGLVNDIINNIKLNKPDDNVELHAEINEMINNIYKV